MTRGDTKYDPIQGQTTRQIDADRGARFTLAHQHRDMGDDPLTDLCAAADLALTKEVARVVFTEYWHPGWRIEASHEDGVVKIGIPALMGENWWGVIRIKELETDPGFRLVKKIAGELLERFKIPRSGITEADFHAALQANPLGYRGLGGVPD